MRAMASLLGALVVAATISAGGCSVVTARPGCVSELAVDVSYKRPGTYTFDFEADNFEPMTCSWTVPVPRDWTPPPGCPLRAGRFDAMGTVTAIVFVHPPIQFVRVRGYRDGTLLGEISFVPRYRDNFYPDCHYAAYSFPDGSFLEGPVLTSLSGARGAHLVGVGTDGARKFERALNDYGASN